MSGNLDVEGWEIAQREIVTTRIFPFSPETVFDAWTDPEKLKRWWGPKGFTNTFHQFEPKAGGVWNFIMHGPDGKNYDNHSQFVELMRPERIVFKHLSPPHFQVLATFDDLGGRTKLTFRQLFQSVDVCKGIKVFALDANEQNFDKLHALLSEK